MLLAVTLAVTAPLLQCLIVPPFLTGRGTSACRRRGPRITRATVLSGSRGDGATDWDGEWSRWQQRVSGESSAGGVDAPLPADELGQGGKENRGQVESWSDDELQRLRLEDRLKQQLPYEYEEIEELYHRIAADESFGASGITIARRKTWSERAPLLFATGARLAVRLSLVAVCLWLAFRWRTQGLESVAGCLLMPVTSQGLLLAGLTLQVLSHVCVRCGCGGGARGAGEGTQGSLPRDLGN